MKPGDREYDLLVEAKREAIRMHKVTQLTESECAQEVKEIQGGAVSIFEQQAAPNTSEAPLVVNSPFHIAEPKRRGRPKGSKNKPKA